jgi:hypothetical protein
MQKPLATALAVALLLMGPFFHPKGRSQETTPLGELIRSTTIQMQGSQVPPLFVAGSGVPHAEFAPSLVEDLISSTGVLTSLSGSPFLDGSIFPPVNGFTDLDSSLGLAGVAFVSAGQVFIKPEFQNRIFLTAGGPLVNALALTANFDFPIHFDLDTLDIVGPEGTVVSASDPSFSFTGIISGNVAAPTGQPALYWAGGSVQGTIAAGMVLQDILHYGEDSGYFSFSTLSQSTGGFSAVVIWLDSDEDMVVDEGEIVSLL